MNKKTADLLFNDIKYKYDPFGGVFKCSEVSLTPFYEKGSINKHQIDSLYGDGKGKINKNEFGDFYEPEVIKDFDCSTCKIFPICGGACPKEWKEGRIPCPSFKINLKERMLMQFLRKKAS